MNYEHPFPRVSGYKKVSDTIGVDITEFFPGSVAYMHAPTFNKWRKKKKTKVTLHILTHGAMRGCGLTSMAACMNDKNRDVRRERNVTMRSEKI